MIDVNTTSSCRISFIISIIYYLRKDHLIVIKAYLSQGQARYCISFLCKERNVPYMCVCVECAVTVLLEYSVTVIVTTMDIAIWYI